MKHLDLIKWLFEIQSLSNQAIEKLPSSYFIKIYDKDTFYLEWNSGWTLRKKRNL